MATRSKYIKVKQQNPTNLPASSNVSYLFGEKCIYNSTYKLILLNAPFDQYDSTGSNWISQGSGSVFVYTYNETTGQSSLTQKISMPNVAVNGTASLRHREAYFGNSIDTFQDWLIIGCPGDIYTEQYDGDYVRNDSFVLDNNSPYLQTIQTGATGSVYFYKWNGSSFEYVNKVRPPLYQDFANPVNSNAFTIDEDPSYMSLRTGNGSSFGASVSVDKSDQTSFSATNPALRKMVAIGAPDAVGVPPEVNMQYESVYRGPFGGVWLAKYNATSLKWELASEKLNPYSFGGYSSQTASSPNANTDTDSDGRRNIESRYDIYDPPGSTYIVPNTASDSKVGQYAFSKFGTNVSIGYYNNIKLIVATKEYIRVEDSFGHFSREDNVFYYDLIYNPSNPDINSFVMRNPYGNRQFYTAMEYTNGSLTPGTAQYAESITGYSSFLDRNAVADNVTNVERNIYGPYNNISRGSAGFCGYPPVVGSTLQTDTGTDYVNDTRLFYKSGIGTEDMKQCGRLAFISTPGLVRSSSKIYPLSDPYTTSNYVTAFENSTGTANYRVSSVEQCESIIIVDLNDLNQLKTKGWVLAGPNSWKINAGAFNWTGGFGLGFDVQQESPTQWVITTTYLNVYQKTFPYAGSPVNDYLFTVDKAQLKTAIYRITYDGTTMSMQTISVIDGKIANPKVYVTGFDNYSEYVFNDSIRPNISGYVAKKSFAFMHAIVPIRWANRFDQQYGFISSALIKNTISNQYHVAEGWCLDNDGTTATSACGSFNLTNADTYDINPSAFLAFCE